MDSKKYIRTITFVSRNKDNKKLAKANSGYKQRSQEFVIETDDTSMGDPKDYLDNCKRENGNTILNSFNNFVSQGLPDEVCRIYWGINVSEKKTVIAQLQHYLIDHEDINLINMDSLVCHLAETAPKSTHHWLFDVDTLDKEKAIDIWHQILKESPAKMFETHSGYAVVSDHGFDTRNLLKDFPEVTLKRNSPLMIACAGNS